jgi:hypothetical protein
MESNKGLSARELEPIELVSELEEYIDPILKWLGKATAIQMERNFRVPHGSGGPPEYYFRLCDMIRKQFSDFAPEGLENWTQEQSDERVSDADRKLKDLNIYVQKVIFEKLKAHYGIEADAYWNKGVVDKEIKIAAYKKSLDHKDEDRLPLENYLDFIEYKKVVENKQNWPLFESTFNIPEPGEKGFSKNLKWMEKINELRRIPAHATEKRNYKVSDFEYIDFIHEEFFRRIEVENAEPTFD